MPRPPGGTRPATRRGGRDAPLQCAAGDARRRELGVGKLALDEGARPGSAFAKPHLDRRWWLLAGQAGSGSARRQARAARNWVAHGQSVGRCSRRRRAERVSRPGRVSRRRRRVLATTWSALPSPMVATQRSRLCGRVATTSQAALARNTPEGSGAARRRLEVADGKFARGVAAVVGVQVDRAALAVGDEGVVAPVRPQRGLGTKETGAAHNQPVRAEGVWATCATPPSG